MLADAQCARSDAKVPCELLGIGVAGKKLLEQLTVVHGQRLEREPHDAAALVVDEIGQCVRYAAFFDRRACVSLECAPLAIAFPQGLLADVYSRLIHEPGQRAQLAQAILTKGLRYPLEGVLRHVLGIGAITEAPHAENEQARVKSAPEIVWIDGRGATFTVGWLSDVVPLGHVENCREASQLLCGQYTRA